MNAMPMSAALAVLTNLRSASGAHFDPLHYNDARAKATSYRPWLLNTAATNMAYMLSAQLSATKLNTMGADLFTNANVIVNPALVPPASVTGLIDHANTLLLNSTTTTAGAARAEQERVKTILGTRRCAPRPL